MTISNIKVKTLSYEEGIFSREIIETFTNLSPRQKEKVLGILRPQMTWKRNSNFFTPYTCSNCGNDENYTTNYCPNCGAKYSKELK